jgi:hypothetical protein
MRQLLQSCNSSLEWTWLHRELEIVSSLLLWKNLLDNNIVSLLLEFYLIVLIFLVLKHLESHHFYSI